MDISFLLLLTKLLHAIFDQDVCNSSSILDQWKLPVSLTYYNNNNAGFVSLTLIPQSSIQMFAEWIASGLKVISGQGYLFLHIRNSLSSEWFPKTLWWYSITANLVFTTLSPVFTLMCLALNYHSAYFVFSVYFQHDNSHNVLWICL